MLSDLSETSSVDVPTSDTINEIGEEAITTAPTEVLSAKQNKLSEQTYPASKTQTTRETMHEEENSGLQSNNETGVTTSNAATLSRDMELSEKAVKTEEVDTVEKERITEEAKVQEKTETILCRESGLNQDARSAEEQRHEDEARRTQRRSLAEKAKLAEETRIEEKEKLFKEGVPRKEKASPGVKAEQKVKHVDTERHEIKITEVSENNLLRLGICAMDKKARSKPMAEILSRLDETLFEAVFFGNDLLLNSPIEEWPVVDVLIAFYSSGYPLDKAESYVDLHKPFVLNDLSMQRNLMDRRKVYDLLQANGIDVPRHVYMSRDGYRSDVKRHPSIDETFYRHALGKKITNNSSVLSQKESSLSISTSASATTSVTATNGYDNIQDSKSDEEGNVEEEEEEKENELLEFDDHIEVNGVSIHKPFVEKPIDADDHNICIYYPSSAGGGCKKLFRKIGNRSSEFYPDINEVRRDGSYIYEEFLETQGTDVKMYTVGPEYGHAEARKSPTVDGKVMRNSDGKEIRYPVILSLREKEIARRIVIAFKQTVCGFDLLRVQEGDSPMSYVCDVNGWSFVKTSRKYYEDCAQILTEHMLAALNSGVFKGFSTTNPLRSPSLTQDGTNKLPRSRKKRSHSRVDTAEANGRFIIEGKSILQRANDSLLLHNKKESISLPETISVGKSNQRDEFSPNKHNAQNVLTFDGSANPPFSPTQSARAVDRDLSQGIVAEGAGLPVRQFPSRPVQEAASISPSAASSMCDEASMWSFFDEEPAEEELRCAIAVIRHGDRTPKQKLKVITSEPRILQYFHDHSKNCRKDLKVKGRKPMVEFLDMVKLLIAEKEASDVSIATPSETSKDVQSLYHMRDVLAKWKIMGLNRKLQIKPRKWQDVQEALENGEESDRGTESVTTTTLLMCTEVQLILKWGGNLTKLGEKQAVTLGKRFRNEIYPVTAGGGILRLHSTFRHDLKIKTSDEGRVMKTAAAFAKGLLELEGEIAPILVSLVHKEKDSLHMLDPSGNKEVKDELEECKSLLNKNLQKDFDVAKSTVEERERSLGPRSLISIHKGMEKVGNPRKALFEMRKVIGELLEQLDEMLGYITSGDEDKIEGGEGLKGKGDEALSGVQLYKGETLLELTERWRHLYKKLYDEDKDTFDLSRIPDVHDNVRFDMLHNPKMGLTLTLERLYTLAKNMADCVVPQEYGITIEEKRTIGNNMCRALLEKIKYDLCIARTDNKVDMRYMINMDYSSDLPINTLGRRVRTRLYFTSESHLHTLANVLRFQCPKHGGKPSPLSKHGMEIMSETHELCYLTQIIFRLFENTKKSMDDPKRFRVEISFSPGATATPLHMSESQRDLDKIRLDTNALQVISKENLTCQGLEDYLSESIEAGHTPEDDDIDITSRSTGIPQRKKGMEKNKDILPSSIKNSDRNGSALGVKAPDVENVDGTDGNEGCFPENQNEYVMNSVSGDNMTHLPINAAESICRENYSKPIDEKDIAESKECVPKDRKSKNTEKCCKVIDYNFESIDDAPRIKLGGKVRSEISRAADGNYDGLSGKKSPSNNNDESEHIKKMAKILAKRYMWRGIAMGSLVLGLGFICLAKHLQDDLKIRRKWTRR